MTGDAAPTTIRNLAAQARGQLEELTGRRAEAVTSVERVDDGWRLCIEVVELERVPATTSILGAYEVALDHEGNLLGYNRIGRYHRNRADEAEQ